MDIVKSYIVGGHKFCVSMQENSVLWNKMDNYSPFLEEGGENIPDSCDSQEPVFCLNIDFISGGEEIVSNSKHLAEFDDDTAYISLMSSSENERVFVISLNRELRDRGGVLVAGSDLKTCRLYMGKCNNERHGIFVVNNALMLLYALSTAVKDTILIHSSVAVADGLGYAFLGKSGTGKSTHTRLWLNNIAGAWLLNDDNPVVRVDEKGDAMVYGSPWSGKTPCYRNAGVPLRAIVRLSQAPYNKINRLTGVSAYAALAPSASSMKWEKSMADGLHETISKIVMSVGIFHLECLPDADAARICHNAIK